MMCIISKENCILRAGGRNARRDIHSVTLRIAIPMQARTQWTHSDVLPLLATTPEWSFQIGDRQNAKRQWNSDRRAIYNATRCIDAGRGVIRHQDVCDGSDGAIPPEQNIFLLMSFPEFTRPRPPSASPNSLDYGLPVHLWVHSISISNWICKLARSRPQSVSLSLLDCHFQVHLELLSSTACSQSRYTVCRLVAI